MAEPCSSSRCSRLEKCLMSFRNAIWEWLHDRRHLAKPDFSGTNAHWQFWGRLSGTRETANDNCDGIRNGDENLLACHSAFQTPLA